MDFLSIKEWEPCNAGVSKMNNYIRHLCWNLTD